MSKLDDFKKFKQKSVVQTPVKEKKEVEKIEFRPVPLAELNRVTSTSKMSAPIQLKKEQEIGQQVAPINTASKPILSTVLPELKVKSEQKQALKDYANWKKAELNQITPQAQRELEANNFTPREQQIVMGIVKGSKEERDAVNLKIAKNKEASPYVAAAQNFFEGASMGLSNLALSEEERKEVDRASSENKAIAIGSNIAGSLIPQGILYKAVNKALAGTKLASVSGGLKGFGASQGTQLVADAIVQTPIEVIRAIEEDKTVDEAGKDWLVNRGLDAIINLGMGTIENLPKLKQFISTPRGQKALADKGIDTATLNQAIDSGDVKAVQDIIYVNQYGVASKEPFEQLQLQAPRNVETSMPTRQIERPFTVTPSEMSQVDKFKQFKAQNPVEVRQSALQVEQPQVSMRVEPTPKQSIPKEPVDTLKMVMTDIPSVRKGTLGEGLERFYQETVSKAAPFETLAKKTDTPLLRASATNLNRTTGTVDYNISKAQSDMDGNNIGDSIQTIFKTVKETERPQFYDYVFNKHNLQRANPETYVRKEDLELFREYRSLKEQLEIDPKNRAVRERLKQFEDLKTEFDNLLKAKPVFGETVTPEISAKKIADYEQSNPQFKEQQQKVTNYFNNLMNEWGVKSGLVSEDAAKMLRDMYPNYVPTYRSQEIAKAMGGDGNFVSNILKKAKGSEKNILPLDQQMAILTDRTIRNARKNEVMTILDDVYQANPEIASKYISNVKKVGEKKVVSDILDVGKEIEAPVVREGDKYLVNFYRNGEPHQMTINKTLYEAIRTMEQDGLDKGLNVVRKYATNPFKGLITQYNPLFAVRNIMRDIPTALIYSNDSVGLVKNVPDAIKEMMTNGKLWNQFQSMGGTRSGLFNYEKGVKVAFDGQKRTAKDILSDAGSKFEAINNFTETLPRFAEYITSIKKGEPPMLALMRSAEITTDFSRFGKQTKRADAVVPYLNASVQGLDKFFRQMIDKPLQTMAKGGLVVSIPALILDQVNKDNEAYNEMTSRERNNYYHIPKGDGTFYRIPRSREVGVLFGTMLEWASRNARGQEVTGDEIIETLKSNFTPVNGFDSNIIKPAINFVNIATGKNTDAKNFFGSNIVPESLQRYSPGQQFTEKTTSLSKALGQYLDVPPVAIDYLIDSYLGVIADVGMPLLTDNKSKALSPFENAFIADPVFKSASVDKFYSNLDKLNKLSADTNRNYDIDSKLVTPYEEERNKLNKLAKQLSDLRKQQTEAQKEKDEEKVRELRIEMNQLSKDAVSSLKTEEELKVLFEKFLRERQVK